MESYSEPVEKIHFQLITIEADDLAQRKLPTDLPIVREGSSYSQEYEEKNPPIDKIEKYGYGILYIRNMTKELPHNFTNELTKHHRINRHLISPHWLIVLGVPSENFQMDLGIGTFRLIDGHKL